MNAAEINFIKMSILHNDWKVGNVPDKFTKVILEWLKTSKDTTLSYGWPPHPNINESIKRLSKQ